MVLFICAYPHITKMESNKSKADSSQSDRAIPIYIETQTPLMRRSLQSLLDLMRCHQKNNDDMVITSLDGKVTDIESFFFNVPPPVRLQRENSMLLQKKEKGKRVELIETSSLTNFRKFHLTDLPDSLKLKRTKRNLNLSGGNACQLHYQTAFHPLVKKKLLDWEPHQRRTIDNRSSYAYDIRQERKLNSADKGTEDEEEEEENNKSSMSQNSNHNHHKYVDTNNRMGLKYIPPFINTPLGSIPWIFIRATLRTMERNNSPLICSSHIKNLHIYYH
ncbi:hypothetical protein H8356DRAFT_1330863 [Neocallimastix lanati (nom. inval.)]|nr:hypothetical protein H8356DRAFT_1330863 [Neocallimastix sp. JGI-2020a]